MGTANDWQLSEEQVIQVVDSVVDRIDLKLKEIIDKARGLQSTLKEERQHVPFLITQNIDVLENLDEIDDFSFDDVGNCDKEGG